MKKLLIASVMALGLSFASCSGTSSTNTADSICDSVCNCNTIDTLAVDSVQ